MTWRAASNKPTLSSFAECIQVVVYSRHVKHPIHFQILSNRMNEYVIEYSVQAERWLRHVRIQYLTCIIMSSDLFYRGAKSWPLGSRRSRDSRACWRAAQNRRANLWCANSDCCLAEGRQRFGRVAEGTWLTSFDNLQISGSFASFTLVYRRRLSFQEPDGRPCAWIKSYFVCWRSTVVHLMHAERFVQLWHLLRRYVNM